MKHCDTSCHDAEQRFVNSVNFYRTIHKRRNTFLTACIVSEKLGDRPIKAARTGINAMLYIYD
jgi:hypothetical protein